VAYTRTWTQVLNLLGSRDADEIDDASREAKVDFTERFTDILYDVEADPWKVRIPGVAIDGTANMRILPVLGELIANLQFDVSTYFARPTAVSIGGVWVCSLPIPRGSTIIGVGFSVFRNTAGATVTCKLVKVEPGGSQTVVATQGAPVFAGQQEVSLGVLSEQITDLADYLLVAEIVTDGVSVTNAQLAAVNVAYKVAGAP
jgi:hypothetical protein